MPLGTAVGGLLGPPLLVGSSIEGGLLSTIFEIPPSIPDLARTGMMLVDSMRDRGLIRTRQPLCNSDF